MKHGSRLEWRVISLDFRELIQTVSFPFALQDRRDKRAISRIWKILKWQSTPLFRFVAFTRRREFFLEAI